MAVRDDKGRFIKGVSGNPGGKPVDRHKYIKKIDTTMKLSDWQQIINKAIDQAKRGDERARRWLSEYLLGKPQQHVDVTSNAETIMQPKLDNLTDDELKILEKLYDPEPGRDTGGTGEA